MSVYLDLTHDFNYSTWCFAWNKKHTHTNHWAPVMID